MDVWIFNQMRKFYLAGILALVLLLSSSAHANSTSYVQANGQLIAKINETGVFYYHSDHLGSTSAITNSEGNVVEEQVNLPFGQLLTGEEKHGFTGKEFDFDLELNYFPARYYDPLTSRFITLDPTMDGDNWFIYSRNNPLKFTDPTGEEPVKEQAGDIEGFMEILREEGIKTLAEASDFVHKKHPTMEVLYVYSQIHGWVDLYHIMEAASWAEKHGKLGAFAAVALEEPLEWTQELVYNLVKIHPPLGEVTIGGVNAQRCAYSANSYEDRISSWIGAQLGLYSRNNPDKEFYENIIGFMRGIKVVRVYKEEWTKNPEKAPGWWNKIPDTYNPYGRPIKLEGTIGYWWNRQLFPRIDYSMRKIYQIIKTPITYRMPFMRPR